MSAAAGTSGGSLPSSYQSSRGHDSNGPTALSKDSMAQRCGRGKQALRANLAVLSDEQVKLATALVGVGQGHLFENWAPPGIDDEDKVKMLNQLAQLDSNYPGGLRAYTLNARQLLLKSKHKLSSLDGYTGEIPSGISLEAAAPQMVQAERQGYAAMHQCAFVLLAGGLGERLGYTGIKVGLPAEITTGRCYLHYYVDSLLALQCASDMGPGEMLRLVIMTSEDTYLKTQDLISRNAHFGAHPDQIKVVVQHCVPALLDPEAHIALHPEDSNRILSKPHGHGDVHRVLYASGTIAWLEQLGFKWLYFFQDTNALALKPLAATLGISVQQDLDMNTMAVPRKPGDACGALMRLRAPDGSGIVNNVEYSEIEGFLGGKPEEVDAVTGESVYPGNTNQFIVKIATYTKCLEASKGLVPEFVNPKYSDDTRTAFNTPTRLECMMQDLPRLMTHASAKVSFVKMDRWICYTPVKNGVKEGALLAAAGLPPMTASTGEADLYAANRQLLRLAGMQVPEAPPISLMGLSIVAGPRVVLAASFALGVGDVVHKVSGGSMSATSTLMLSGANVRVENLDLDGTLIVRAVSGANVHLKDLVVKNRGWAIEPLKEGGRRAPEELRVRGYQLVKYEQRVLEFSQPGNYYVTE